MKVYLAGPWTERKWVEVFAQQFRDRDIILTHDWWNHDFPWEDTVALARCAQDDVDAVKACDVMVLVNSSKSEGKAVEQGIALALGKPIVAIRWPGAEVSKNIFHHLPQYTWVNHPDEVWEELLRIGKANQGSL